MKQNGINRKVSIIKAALTWAEEEELAGPNPIARFKCPRGEDEKMVPPSPAEVRRILAVAPPHILRAVLLSFYLGVRVGASELFRIGWEHVDLERGVVHVRSARKNKAVAWREVGIAPALAPLLAAWGDKDAWTGPLVHYEGHAIGHMRRAWATTLAAAGITRPMTPYSLRHAFATYALEGGADIGALAKVMGHSSTAMIHRNYQHVLDSQRRQVTAALPNVTDIQARHTAGEENQGGAAGFCMSQVNEVKLKQ
jgi:integrase